MPTKETCLLCGPISLDSQVPLEKLMERARVTWVSPEDKAAFLSHRWPAHQTEHTPTRARYFAIVSIYDPKILYETLLRGKCVCPATLHEVLALVALRPGLEWTQHDLAVVGTRAGEHCPTVALRKDELYLGVERLSLHDPPSFIMVSY